MPDLVFSWRMLGIFPGEFGPSQSADVGGVEVTVDVTGLSTNARAFGLEAPFYVAPGETFDPSSGFKLFGDGAEGGPHETLTATIDFAATDPAFGDAVENVSFRVADIDAGAAGDIPGGPAGTHIDLVTIRAYDADGNAVPVTITPGTGILQSGDLLTGTAEDQDPTSVDASALVEIAGPVARIEIDYANGADSEQRIIVSDLHFSTTDPGPALDGIVEGTAGDDLIDLAYDGDPEGDVIDGGDNIFPGLGPDDDIVEAGAGNDTVFAEAGDDTVYGGQGDDLMDGGDGVDFLSGDDDRDTFVGLNAGDHVDGGAGGHDYDTLDLTGSGPLRIVDTTTDSDGNGLDGTVEFLDGSGGVTGSATFTNIEEIIPCFTPGTVIATPRGERLVEDLKPGDRVITRDNGIQEIVWVGAKTLTGHQLARMPHLRPILIEAGALGNGLPERDLLVSPNHRLLVANDKTTLYFDEREVLAAAKHLTGLEGVEEVGTLGVTYLHFMFERHEVVLSNGAWTESFQPGDYTLQGIGNAQRNEILELFPELEEDGAQGDFRAARRTLKKHEARLLHD